MARLRGLLRDRRGNYSMIMALLLPVIVGFAGMGTEMGMWFYTHQSMQAAADAAAFSAANAAKNGGTPSTEALAVAANMGFPTGAGCTAAAPPTGGTCVELNSPPKYSHPTCASTCYEVAIGQYQQQLFSKLFLSNPVLISAAAVSELKAAAGGGGTTNACVLTLDTTDANTFTMTGGTLNLSNCNLQVNSDNANGFNMTGGSLTVANLDVNATEICGGSCAGGTITGTRNVNAGAAVDPYAGLYAANNVSSLLKTPTQTSYAACSGTTTTVTASKNFTTGNCSNIVVVTASGTVNFDTSATGGTFADVTVSTCGACNFFGSTYKAISLAGGTNTFSPTGTNSINLYTSGTTIGTISISGGTNTFDGGGATGAVTYNMAFSIGSGSLTLPSNTIFNGGNNPAVTNSGGSVTLNPGVYVGGISITGGTSTTFNPGVYILEGGTFTINGGSSITGSGVTFILTCKSPPCGSGSSYATLNLTGGAATFTAPTSGPWSGILFYGDPSNTGHLGNDTVTGGSYAFQGAIYLPEQLLTYSGGVSASTCIQIVAYQLQITGGASFNNCTTGGLAPITTMGGAAGAVATLVE